MSEKIKGKAGYKKTRVGASLYQRKSGRHLDRKKEADKNACRASNHSEDD